MTTHLYSLKPNDTLSNSCQDRFYDGSPKSVLILLGPWMSDEYFIAIHTIVVEIFQSGPKWWTERPSFRAMPQKMYYLIHHLDLGLLSVLQASHETIPKFYIVEENQIPTKRNIIIMNEKHYIHHAV